MDITIKKPLGDNPRNILRKAGYSEYYDRKTQKTSYSLRLGSEKFPKFHCYIKESENSVSFSLHIDQKQASYEGSRMHAGEYDGKLVEEEIARIGRWARAPIAGAGQSTSSNKSSNVASAGTTSSGTPSMPSNTPKQKKKGFFGKLFG